MLFENPFFIVVLGVLATFIPFMLWVSVGESRTLLYIGLASLAFFATWLSIERYVETDREAVHRTIYELRDLVRKNQIDELLEYVETPSKSAVWEELKRFDFVGCGVSNLSNHPDFRQAGGETYAEVTFIGSARAKNYSGTLGPVRLKLELRKAAPGEWKVVDYGYKLMGDQSDDYRKHVPVL